VTNNAGISREKMANKMRNGVFNYKNAHVSKLYPACTLAAQYVRQFIPDCKKVRYIGMESMGEELRSNGLETIGGSKGDPKYDEEDTWFSYEDVANYPYDPEIKAVITGIDLKVNYSKIVLAS